MTTSRVLVDDLGHEVEVTASPDRLVSLVPSLSEVLWWWHLADQLVGVTDYCVAPPRAFQHARTVRGPKNPDVAAIIDLQPDLIVANEEENRPVDVERMRAAGLSVYVTKVRTVAGAAASLQGLGEAVGAVAPADQLAASLRRAIDGAAGVEDRLKVVCPIWRDGAHRGADETWWVLGRDTYAADLLRCAGFDIVPVPDSEEEQRYPRFLSSELLDADPDVVLLPDEPYVFTEDDATVFRDWRAVTRLLDGTGLVWWGPRTPSALSELGQLRRTLRRRHR